MQTAFVPQCLRERTPEPPLPSTGAHASPTTQAARLARRVRQRVALRARLLF